MNYIWFLLIVISIIYAGHTGRLDLMVNGIFAGIDTTVKTTFYLIGIMAFWVGIMRIAEKSGIVDFIAKIIKPVLKKIFPELKNNNKALADIAMNFSANMFGLSNAATPIGMKAMEEMQKENPNKKVASNPMCTFLTMNTAAFQLVPATVIAILVANGFKNPTQIILPTLIVTSITFTLAILIVKILEKIYPPQDREDE